MKTIIEPFKTKVVESIAFTSTEQRQKLLEAAGFNLFQVRAEHVIVDLLTDSGTSAMSSKQWAALMAGDESYAGCSSFYRLKDTVKDIFGFSEVIPVHQGRAAERLLFSCLAKPGDLVPSNTHFDTTRANLLAAGAIPVDLPAPESADLYSAEPFKGNIDIAALKRFILENGEKNIPFAMLTITNNACGGQPASLQNIREYAAVLRHHGIPLYIDAARFAENAFLIKERENGESQRTLRSIVSEIFELSYGCLMSAKKMGSLTERELVRLALPRRVYSQSHWDYVTEAAQQVLARRASVAGMKIVWQPPSLRHFTATFKPLVETSSATAAMRSPVNSRPGEP